MKKICIITAVPDTINAFLKEHIHLISQNYSLTIITSSNHNIFSKIRKKSRLISVNIKRKTDLYNDFKSLIKLKKIFNNEKFDLILSITPKAGLLASLASCLSGINNIRIHWFTGQIWATKTGPKRKFFKYIDKLIVSCVNYVLVDSHSQFKFLKSENVLDSKKGKVLGNGSISGVDLKLFKFSSKFKKSFRNKIGLDYSDKVILFLGRLNKDKGVYDLIEAFNLIVHNIENLHLVLIGPDEENIKNKMTKLKTLNSKIHFIGKTNEPQKWLCIGDIFCLPSYREGFGSSVIEAAAIGIPSVTSKIYGLKDTVINGRTGLTHSAGNINEIANAIKKLIIDKKLRYQLGKNAKKRVKLFYGHTYLSHLFLDYIKKILDEKQI